MPDDNDGPRIISDSDWKEEARREKEEADRETREMPGAGDIPEPSFAEIIQMIIIQASIGLGGMQDPQTGQRIPAHLPVAKHYIDLLELLRTKTAKNLPEEEQKLLDGTLHELQMAFVQVAGVGAVPPDAPRAPDA
jgi:hypothetical protein